MYGVYTLLFHSFSPATVSPFYSYRPRMTSAVFSVVDIAAGSTIQSKKKKGKEKEKKNQS